MITKRKAVLFVQCVIGLFALNATITSAQSTKVDVCHVPPEHPEYAYTIAVNEEDVDAYLEQGDSLGPCPIIETAEEEAPAEPCACPKHGVWTVRNLDGWMECNALGLKRTIRGEAKNDGAIWIMKDDCSTIFSEAYKKDAESVVMHRGKQCQFFGLAPGEEGGAKAIFDGGYTIESEEFITGEYHMKMSGMGADCTGYRPFEIEYKEPLSEKKYAKLEKKMQEALVEAQEKKVEYVEIIDEYLVEVEGRQAYREEDEEEEAE